MAGEGTSLMGVGVGADNIYRWFAESKGPTHTDASEQTWQGIADGQLEISELINKAVRDSGASWEGAAGDAARTSTTPLASWSDTASTSATTAGTSSAEISAAFRDAANNVMQPVAVPDKPWYNDALPWDTDYDEAVDKHNQVNDHNMRVYESYGARVESAIGTLPTFEAPGEIGGTVEGEEEIVIPPPKPGREGEDETGTGRGTGDGTTDRTGTGTTKPSWTDPPPVTPPGTLDDGTTKPSWVQTDPSKPMPDIGNRPPELPRDPRSPYDPRLPYDP
ncbi:MAG: hypothetical protein HOV94_08200, partial [Saccharothrix sp.]|nr:hypothetical protein [Saccharothrix sp.]